MERIGDHVDNLAEESGSKMKIIWTIIRKQKWKTKTKQRVFVFFITVVWGLLGAIIWSLTGIKIALNAYYSKFGMLLSGIMVLVVAAFFYMLSMMIDQTLSSTGTNIVLSRQMLFIMVSYGATRAMKAGAVIGGAMIVACPIFKLVFRER